MTLCTTKNDVLYFYIKSIETNGDSLWKNLNSTKCFVI